MPFSSRKQARWMFANKPEMAKEFADETPNFMELPEHKGGKTRERLHRMKVEGKPRKRKRYGE